MKQVTWMSFVVVLAGFAAVLSACGESGSSGTIPVSSGPATRPAATRPGSRVLNLYIWAEYIPQGVLDTFEARTGIHVHQDNYDSNETLLQKLQSGVAEYDVCVPSDYMIKPMIASQLLLPLDHARLANLKNVEPRFLDRKFDPGNRYCVPYLWGTTGLGYNKEKIAGPVDSWQVMFDAKNKRQILMLDDMRECFAVALKLMGKSLNDASADDLKAAADLLKKQHELVKKYDSSDYDNTLERGEVALAHGYNGQLAKKVAAHPDKFAYVIPKEGATVSMDGLCIPVKAQHVEEAMAFLNFIMEPEVAAEIVNGVNYASTNAAARPFIKPEILNNPAIYPTDEMLKNCEMMEDLGEATTVMDRYWTEIKAQ